MELWQLLADIVLLLAACLVGGGLVSRMGQSPLVYFLVGIFVGGPGSPGLIQSIHEIEAIAEHGVALLLFSIGLEFPVSRLKELGTSWAAIENRIVRKRGSHQASRVLKPRLKLVT